MKHARRLAQAALAAALASSVCSAQISGCDNLGAVPMQFTIGYQAAIQGIFDSHCIACHASYIDCDSANDAQNAPAGLDLCPGVSWVNIVNHPSSLNAAYTRVVPNEPQSSLLFHKINCSAPEIGSRMPYGEPELSADEQALILDWIAGGAPFGTTDTIFRGEFESRG